MFTICTGLGLLGPLGRIFFVPCWDVLNVHVDMEASSFWGPVSSAGRRFQFKVKSQGDRAAKSTSSMACGVKFTLPRTEHGRLLNCETGWTSAQLLRTRGTLHVHTYGLCLEFGELQFFLDVLRVADVP